jgi:secreted trypsin-like serine protease
MRLTVMTLLITTAAGLLAPTGTAPAPPTPMIVGGGNATETYSFMAALSSTDGWGCGASLIRPTWIVTAKHCVTLDNGDQSTPASLSFRIGSLYQDSGGSVAKAKRVVRYGTDDADVALVELTAPVAQQPIDIAASAPVGTASRIIGWGCRSDACDDPPNPVLQQLDTSILDDSACGGGQYYLCINNPDGWRGACYGDSGGPAVIKNGARWTLVGATSGGTGLCGENPSFYVDLPNVRSWIESYAGPNGGSTGVNLALNRPAKSAQPSCNADEVPAKAVNGSVSGGNSDKWCSGYAGAKTLEVDLGANHQLTSLVVRHAGAGGESTALNTRNFTLETSTGGGVWSPAATVSNNTASTTTNAVQVNARWIRLTTTDAVARIYEFEAY